MRALDDTEFRGVPLPRHRVAARPVAVRARADLERHLQSFAEVVTSTAHLGELPSRSEVARAPFGIRLEAAAGEYNRPRLEFHRLSPLFHPHAEHTHAVINERDCPRFIEDL